MGTRPKILGADFAVMTAYLFLLKQFRRAHAAAWALWRAGYRDVVFPHGADRLPRLLGAAVEPRPGTGLPPPVGTAAA